MLTADSNKLFGWDWVPNLNEKKGKSGAIRMIGSIFLRNFLESFAKETSKKISALLAANDGRVQLLLYYYH